MADVSKIIKGGLKAIKEAESATAKTARAIGKKPREVPPPFERAPAKTKAEIDAIAQRIAPQLTGEFVRLNPKQSVNPVGKSKKRFEYEKTLEHDIRPYTEIIEPENFDYAANQGRVQLGIFGDPTLSQHDIYGIAGRELPVPSRQFGGPRYAMDKPEEAWASNFGAASGLQAAAKQASQQYGGADVVGLYSKMSQDSYDFAQHVTDSLMKNIMLSLPDMSKKDIAGFNAMVRNNPKARDFAGIENPDIALAQMEKNPEMRKQFYWRATTPTVTEAFNMPNGLDAVHASIIPELRNLETGITGHTVVEIDPDVTHLHASDRGATTTYDTSIPRKAGTEVKKLEALTPIELSFPDQLLEISKNPRQAGPNAFGTLKGQGARQIIDPQLIDEIGTYRDFIKKYTGKKKGGAVYKAAKEILSKDKKFAKGGAVEDDIDYITSDPVAYLQNEIKPIDTKITSSEEFSRRIGKPIPALNPAIAMIRKGINPVIEALREDVEKIKPRAAIDVPINAVSEILGAPVDIANELRDPITPIRSDIVSTMKDYKLPPSEALPGSSKSFKKATTDIGLTSGEDYPALQFAAGMIGVPEVKAIGAAAKAGVKGYGNLVKEAIGRDAVPFLRAKDFQMNILPERGVNLGVDFTRPSEDTILGHKMESMPGSQWYSWLQSNAPKSAKKELETAGTMNWLKDNKGKLSKTDIINHLRENEPNLRSKTYTEYSDSPYEVYGGDDGYHVVNTSISDKPISSHETQGEAYWALNELESELYPKPKYEKYTLPGQAKDYREIVIQDKPKIKGEEPKFTTQHFEEATNPVAHLRVNHRNDVEGNPTLFIEELQSDWAQRGKKHGFTKQEKLPDMDAQELLVNYGEKLSTAQRDWLNKFSGRWDAMMDDINRGAKPESAMDVMHREYNDWISKQKIGINPGPYVEDTKDWTSLALKQAIKEAVDNGKTQVAWTTGAQQADRYDLSKQLSSVSLHPREDGTFALNAYDHEGRRVIQEKVTEDNLDDYIGKDLANKLINTPTGGDSNIRRLEGLDIKVGGEGMKGYYDNIVPQVANDILKQLGSKEKVQTIKIKTKNFAEGSGWNYRRIIDDITGNVTVVDRKGDVVKTFNGPSYMENRNNAMKWQQDNDPSLFNEQMGFKITPEMVKRIKEKGIPKFKKGGVIDLNKDYKLENLRRRYG